MKLSEIKGDNALDILAEIIEPAMEIMTDKAVLIEAKKGNTIGIVKLMCREHKKSVVKMLAILDGEDPETYEVGLLTLPGKLLEMLNDPEFQRLFISPGQKVESKSSGSASASTKDLKK